MNEIENRKTDNQQNKKFSLKRSVKFNQTDQEKKIKIIKFRSETDNITTELAK